MTEYTVKQGNTSPVVNIGSSSMVSTDGWTCNLRVLDFDSTAIIDRNITETNEANDKFLVYLTPAETGAIAVESYRMVVELSNAALTPPFNVEQHHIITIDPQMEVGDATGLVQLIEGTNSFDSFEELLLMLPQMPHLKCAISADRASLKGALVGAYQNIGFLTTDFQVYDDTLGVWKVSTADFTDTDLTELSQEDFDKLVRAQLTEANGLLGAYPIEDRRRAGMLSDSVGESAMFFRTRKPLELPVYKETAWVLKGFIMWTKSVSR